MWKITLGCNIIVLGLLWLLSMLAITPAYNLLVQYAEVKVALPVLTDFAMQISSDAWIVPVIWIVCTLFLGKWLSRQPEMRRNEWLGIHTSLSLCLGLAMLAFFATGGILPILKIGATILPTG